MPTKLHTAANVSRGTADASYSSACSEGVHHSNSLANASGLGSSAGSLKTKAEN